MKTLFLSKSDVDSIVKRIGINSIMDEAIAELEKAFLMFDPAATEVFPRAGFVYDLPQPGVLEWMPVHRRGLDATIKVVGYNPSNPQDKLCPTIMSSISRYDISTGHLIACIAGNLMTAIRTGAASAVVSRRLARDGQLTLGFIGCGAQAITQLHALSRVLNIMEVLIYDIDNDAAESFTDRARFIGLPVKVANLKDLVANSDVITTATSVEVDAGPVFQDIAVKPWLHINAIGSDLPGKTEVPQSLLKRAFICTDLREQAKREGECQQLDDASRVLEIHEILKNPTLMQNQKEKLSVFDSTGYALEDQVMAEIILKHAEHLRIGSTIEFEDDHSDPKNPYAKLKINPPMRSASALTHEIGV